MVFLSAFVLRASKKDLKPSRLVLTDKSIYFLRKKFMCFGTGLTFSDKYQTKDILDLTLSQQESSIIIRMDMEDDIYLQILSSEHKNDTISRDQHKTIEAIEGKDHRVKSIYREYGNTESSTFISKPIEITIEEK